MRCYTAMSVFMLLVLGLIAGSLTGCPNKPVDPGTEGTEGEGATKTIMLPGDVPLVMVWIPAGTFQMGVSAGEGESEGEEVPQHRVTLAKGFWMGKYEVTKAQWKAVMNTTPWTFSTDSEPPQSPASSITWDDAKEFTASLNVLLGNEGGFRLPSEAQWEYACRAGTTTRFYWGDDPDYTLIGDYVWYDEDSVHVVGQKLPNAFGLYDMIGNVWEWCEDDWHDDYTGASLDGSAWVDNPRSSYRVLRGGSWGSLGGYVCRSASRSGGNPSGTLIDIGFRLTR